jgi:hypothetical protein
LLARGGRIAVARPFIAMPIMAYWALGRIAKKEGRNDDAYEWYSKIQGLNMATDSDLIIIETIKKYSLSTETENPAKY